MILKREIECLIKEQAKYYQGILLTGVRQAGKSTILKEMFGEKNRHIFDDPIERESANNDSIGYINNLSKPAILDEIQKLNKSFFPALKLYFEYHDEKGSFFLTGSQPIQLLKAAEEESLAGRIAILNMTTLSLRELDGRIINKPFNPNIINDNFNTPNNDIWQLIFNGSYPERYRLNQPPYLFYPSYIELYLKKDIKEIVDIKDEITFDRYLQVLASQTGQMLNYNKIAKELQISVDTIKRWTSILAKLGVIYLLSPYYNNVFSRAIKTPKIYFMDTGLVCYLGRWLTKDVAMCGAMSGQLYETFVVSEIIKSYINNGYTFDHLPLYFYNGKDKVKKTTSSGEVVYEQAEIDLIIEEGNILYPIEIKKTSTPTSSMTSAFKILDKDTYHKRGIGTIICNYPKKKNLESDLQIINPHMI